ncbi:putative toxin-antitoxin system toxin component, PIN family [Gracilimonas sediminicola]|uniref:Toxin-antitoxin system toxin component, PIN family n=1 Tax=Gracilimonas sediminicola TaxID=2952158 RepID=A0A9X2L2M3_9BACT|nr:putative toxin-antitoxin system toxin component, PIN family [Gracilimonas sediminicola]MCP9291137.1 putative toxin-antitoxin system toxin component, PIN family [Gracilimonas sediminicola]
MLSVVIDTNVIISALRSNQGASFRLVSLIGTGKFNISLSVPLLLEYESVSKRKRFGHLIDQDIDDFLNYLCKVADKRDIFFLWRPFLKDPKDDMILELAVEADCEYIITYNLGDFRGIDHFGLKALTPKEFLIKIGEL